MLKLSILLLVLLAGAWLPGCCTVCCEDSESSATAMAADDEDEDEDRVVSLDKVPAIVLAAGRAALPGVLLTGAEIEQEHGQLVYCLIGSHNGEAVEIEVTAAGKVLEIERGEDD
ncbi:MAG: PepSY domain-containing protein [Planctomycetota bacterium]